MQNNFVTDAINLKSYNLSESDKIIVMYSKDKGLIRGVAKGVKKPKSKLGARMDMLVANKIMLHKGKNLDTICQADVLNTFNKTRKDLDKIFYSMYVTEVVNNFGLEEDPGAAEIYDILYKALNSISEAKNEVELLISVIKFQLKMMKESGFCVELDRCLHCHKKVEDESMYFVSGLGGIICKDCYDFVPHNKRLMPYKLRDFFKQMTLNDFDTVGEYEQKANKQVCLVTYNVLKDYIEKKSPKKMKTSSVFQDLSLV